jgi:uncharacterized protein (DUF362 family)
MNESRYCVRAVNCDHRASDDEVYAALKRATAPLHRSWARLRAAKTIVVKFNQDFVPAQVVMLEGQRQQLVSDSVARAVLRLLREETTARIFCADTSVYIHDNQEPTGSTTTVAPLLRQYGVEYLDASAEPVRWYDVPGGGLIFARYPLAEGLVQADAVISVAKMKNHGFMGVTLCLKNLFGLMPFEPLGRPRSYYHHIVRMPYMLADIGRLLNPALNVIDALVGQAEHEWGNGQGKGRIVNGLLAGDNVIATDACGTYLMGHDPYADWPDPPFHRDRNALLVAAESGLGTVTLSDIDFVSELRPQPDGVFYTRAPDSRETVTSWRKTMCEQALYYRDHRAQFKEYEGDYVLIQEGQVRWRDPIGRLWQSRRQLAGGNPQQSMWLKYVDPDEVEGERYEVYEQALRSLDEQASHTRKGSG